MANFAGPLRLKTLRLKPLREEETMSTVGASTGGVRKLQRRRPPPPPSRRKTKRSLRGEGIMKNKKKEKPVLQVLLIAALALNTTLSFVVLANRNRMAQATVQKDPVPAPAVITLEGATVEGKTQTRANPASRPDGASPNGTHAAETTARKTAPATIERLSRRKEEIIFFPSPVLYQLTRDAILVTRRDGARILIPKGTVVRVAGVTHDHKALVVSRRGNPDGLIAAASLGAIPDEHATAGSFALTQRATVNVPSRGANIPGRFRLSGGPYGGSIGLGGGQIFVGRNGQVSGSLSR
jgi:hypothetical protein